MIYNISNNMNKNCVQPSRNVIDDVNSLEGAQYKLQTFALLMININI